MLHPKVIAAAQAHAIEAFPRESCGMLIDGVYVRCRNVHEKPEQAFRIAADQWADAFIAGDVQAVIHSHPGGPDYPNADDMTSQVATALPWAIICTDGKIAGPPIWFGDQAEMPPLLGRGFRHGVTDCLSLIRDTFRLDRAEAAAQLEIAGWPFDRAFIPEFPRDWEWWLKDGAENPHFYRDCFGAAGFVEVEDGPLIGDVWRVTLPVPGMKSATPNHAGIYLGGNIGLHHRAGGLPVDHKRTSRRVVLGAYADLIRAHKWLRYRA